MRETRNYPQPSPLYLPGQGRVTQIKGFGHSYMAYPNIALSQSSDSYMARLATALGVTNNNLGVPGGALIAALAVNAGGWQYVFNQLPRGTGSARDQVVILDFGIDDVAQAEENYGTYTAGFKAAYASVISRIRATPGSIKLANDASIAYTGSWTYDSGATFSIPVNYSFTSGNSYTITLPSNFPGGTLCIDLLTGADDGATHTFTLDGDPAGSINTVGLSGGVEITPSVMRIHGVSIGTHTIVGTISAMTATTTRTEVVGYHYETNPLPVVFCLNQPKLINYTTFASLGRPTEADVGIVNADIEAVVATFDSNVVVVDIDSLFDKQQTLFMYYDGVTSDYVHPGPLGHDTIAKALEKAIRTHPAGQEPPTTNALGWAPTDYGFINWAFDPAMMSTGFQLTGYAGYMWTVKVPIRQATTISNLILDVVAVAGGTLTSGQCFAALYQNGALLAKTASQHANWQTTGVKVMPLATTQAVQPGFVTVGFYFNGTTAPAFGYSQAIDANFGQARYGLDSHSGLTTAPPSTLGTFTPESVPFWAAVS